MLIKLRVTNLSDLMPDDLRWSWCNNNRNRTSLVAQWIRRLLVLKVSKKYRVPSLLGFWKTSEGLGLLSLQSAPVLFMGEGGKNWRKDAARGSKCLPMQGAWVQSLVQEDSTCHEATKPMHHNYWACVLQGMKPKCLQPVLRNKASHRNEKPEDHNEEQPLITAIRESPCKATKTQCS